MSPNVSPQQEPPGGAFLPPQAPPQFSMFGQPQGQYANFVQVGSTQWDFFVDFGILESAVPLGQPGPAPGQPTPATIRPVSRIILSPENIKGLYAALGDTIRQYEQAWGVELPDMRTRQARPASGTAPSQSNPSPGGHR